jgi:hypothetical protein
MFISGLYINRQRFTLLEIFGVRTSVPQFTRVLKTYPSRSIAVLVISNRANRSYVLTEPKAKGYASECNELVWLQKDSSLMELGLDSSEI